MTRFAGRPASLAAFLAAAIAATLSSPAGAAVPTISAYNEPGFYGGHYWTPSSETVASGGTVRFVNPYPTTYHGIKFTGGSAGEAPTCTGIPQAATEPIGAYEWEGECKFTKPGTYTFICTVHPAEMTGTIVVPGTPKAKTTAASGATQTEATLAGVVEPEGNAVQYHFEYGAASVSEHVTVAAPVSANDFASHPVSTPVSGLLPEKTYRFKLIATYGSGSTLEGEEKTFATPPATAPSATTLAAANVKASEATLKGTVDPQGAGKAEYLFEWGPAASSSFENATGATSLPADGAQHTVSFTLASLLPETRYRYRLVARNELGTTDGKEVEFTTSAAPVEPPVSEPSPSPPPAPGESPPAPSGAPTSAPPVVLAAPPSEALGPAVAGSLRLKASAHGASLRGSLTISSFGAGGRLEVDLLASGAAFGRHGRGAARPVLVGRLRRSSLHAGGVSFAVGLDSRARSVLRRRHRLAVTVRIVLRPVGGAATVLTRAAVLRS